MKKLALFVFMAVAFSAVALGQAQPPSGPPTVSMVLDRQISGPERELVPLVEAMPEEKFGFAPSNGEFKGVRTFGEQARHIAYVNHLLAAAILGEKPTMDAGKGENGPELTTKAEIVKSLKDSFAYLHKAIATINEKNQVEVINGPFGGKATRMGLATMDVGHIFDHYGQMVVYLRMNGIIPPASRQQ